MPYRSPPPQVIKLGGSLLSSEGGLTRAIAWLQTAAARPAAKRVLLVGGGAAVEGLRKIDDANALDPARVHFAAIAAMDTNTRLVADRLPAWRLSRQIEAIRRGDDAIDWLFAPGDWLRRQEPAAPGARLPLGWQVTSDSIAARVAEVLGAELTLLKSSGPPLGVNDLTGLAQAGYVDGCFPVAAARVAETRLVGLPPE